MSSEASMRHDSQPTLEPAAQLSAAERDRLQQLCGTISHDFNNAIFAATGRLELLKRRMEDPALRGLVGEVEKTIRFFESINAAVAQAAHRQYPTASPRNAIDAVQAALVAAQAQSNEALIGVQVSHAVLPSAEAQIRADADALLVCCRQVMTLHAMRLAHAGSLNIAVTIAERTMRVTFEDSATRSTEQAITNFSAPPSFLHPGFAAEQLPLATAQRALRECGGTVALAMAPSGGLRTTVTLAVVAELRRLPSRVLIADDEMLLRALLVQMLETLGADVTSVEDPGSIDTHEALHDQELLIVDAAVPSMCGLKALQRIRAAGIMTPAILISGSTVDEAIPLRTSVLLKPFTTATLEAACHAAISKG